MEHCPLSQVVNFVMDYSQAAFSELTKKLLQNTGNEVADY